VLKTIAAICNMTFGKMLLSFDGIPESSRYPTVFLETHRSRSMSLVDSGDSILVDVFPDSLAGSLWDSTR
jgi:hypothetical protein